jgi:hypothetical protein
VSDPAAQPARLFDDHFLRFLPAPLREPRRAWLAIPIGWALSFLGSLVLAIVVHWIAPDAKAVEVPKLPAWLVIAAFAVFAPVVESILMGLLLKLLQRWLMPATAVLVSAVCWGIFHSLQVPVWGLAIWWPFLIFSTLFVVWQRRGFWTAVGVAAATHSLQNLAPSLAMAYPNLIPGLS